ncbi:Uncharacterised protein [Streptococcus pneumoniae]|nr:Uncharacterised protein [Streptococcus pneumoniae]
MYLVLAIGFSIAFVSAAFAMSSDILDDIMSSGTETYSRYLTGFLKFIPLTLIAILMFFFSSLKDGKNLNITAIGMDTFFEILSLSIDEIIAPTSEVFIIKLAAINGKINILITIGILKNILTIGFNSDNTIKLGKE